MQAFQELHGRIEKVSQKDGQKQGDDDPGSVVEKSRMIAAATMRRLKFEPDTR